MTEAKIRSPRNDEGITDEKRTLFAAARKIADIVFEYASPDVHRSLEDIWLEDRRQEGVNPFYSQTTSGLFLELYYGQPAEVWTPWGKYGFGGSGSGSWREAMPKLLERLGATVHIEEYNDQMGTHGPVYAIHSVDGQPLPEPVAARHDDFMEYEVARDEWKSLLQDS